MDPKTKDTSAEIRYLTGLEKAPKPRHPEYEVRILAFVDILGWSDLTRKSEKSAVARKRVYEGAVRLFSAGEPDNDIAGLIGGHFSDTLVISAPADEVGAMAIAFRAQHLCVQLLELGHYTRGAIVVGKLFHQQGIIYGPALVRAHEIEARVAIYPRVVVSVEAQELVSKSGNLYADRDGLLCLNICHREKAARVQKMLSVVGRRAARDKDMNHRAKSTLLLQYLQDCKGSARTRP